MIIYPTPKENRRLLMYVAILWVLFAIGFIATLP